MVTTSTTSLATVSLLLLFIGVAAFDGEDYGKRFHGDGTYYGGNPFSGNCAMRSPLPGFYKKYLAVAINEAQYKYACGACLELRGNGKGLGAKPIRGPILAYVADRCFECKHGDLDLSSVGDGRWDISWNLIPCPGEDRISFQFEGSNSHFWKLQPRGMRSPATKVLVNGKPSAFKQDNHWVFEFAGGVRGAAKVEVFTVLGEHITSHISKWHGVVYGGLIGGGSSRPVGNQGKRGDRSRMPRKESIGGGSPRPVGDQGERGGSQMPRKESNGGGRGQGRNVGKHQGQGNGEKRRGNRERQGHGGQTGRCGWNSGH